MQNHNIDLMLYLSAMNNPIFFGIWGLMVGSFLNVVVYRLPKIIEQDWAQGLIQTIQDLETLKSLLPSALAEKIFKNNKDEVYSAPVTVKNLSVPASHCPVCNKKISWYENIPVLSWLFLRGRCSNCSAKISAQYPAVELITGLFFLAIVWLNPTFTLLQNTVYTSLCATALALILIDYKKQLLPDALLGIFLFLTLFIYAQHWNFLAFSEGLKSAAISYSVLWLLSRLGYSWKGTTMMGEGDLKLVFILGFYVEALKLPYAFTAAFAIFIAQVIISNKVRENSSPTHAFGPSLILGFLFFQCLIK